MPGARAGSLDDHVDQAIVALARDLAEEVLLPGATEVDASPLVPLQRLDALAERGLYGLVGPRRDGGLGAGPATANRVLEELAAGCLTTAFVFAQHHSAVRTLAKGPEELARRFLGPLCRGELRSGVAFSGLRGAAPLSAREQGGGFVLEGTASWVTGWGRIDLVHVAALTGDDRVVWALVDAEASRSLEVHLLRLGAVQASGTVSLAFHGLRVAAEAVTLIEPVETWRARDALGLRPNGSHALGLARRCLVLAGEADPESAVAPFRRALDSAGPDALPAARAEAALLAQLAAARLVASAGGKAVLVGTDVERLAREASFLLVFGQTPAIKAELLWRLDPSAGGAVAAERSDRR